VSATGALSVDEFTALLRQPPGCAAAARLFAIFCGGSGGSSGGGGARQLGFQSFALWAWNLAQRDREGPALFAFAFHDVSARGRLRAADSLALVASVWGPAWRLDARARAALSALCAEHSLAAIERAAAHSRAGGAASLDAGATLARAAAAVLAARCAAPVGRFLAVAARCPLLLLPTYELQLALQRAVLGLAHWEAAARGAEARAAARARAAAAREAWRAACARAPAPLRRCLAARGAAAGGGAAAALAREAGEPAVEDVCDLMNRGRSREASFAPLPPAGAGGGSDAPPPCHFVRGPGGGAAGAARTPVRALVTAPLPLLSHGPPAGSAAGAGRGRGRRRHGAARAQRRGGRGQGRRRPRGGDAAAAAGGAAGAARRAPGRRRRRGRGGRPALARRLVDELRPLG